MYIRFIGLRIRSTIPMVGSLILRNDIFITIFFLRFFVCIRKVDKTDSINFQRLLGMRTVFMQHSVEHLCTEMLSHTTLQYIKLYASRVNCGLFGGFLVAVILIKIFKFSGCANIILA